MKCLIFLYKKIYNIVTNKTKKNTREIKILATKTKLEENKFKLMKKI